MKELTQYFDFPKYSFCIYKVLECFWDLFNCNIVFQFDVYC